MEHSGIPFAASSWWSPESQPFTLRPSFLGEKSGIENTEGWVERISATRIHWPFIAFLGQGDGEEQGSPALGVVAQSWHHSNIPKPPLISSAGLRDALCRIHPSRDSQGTGTGLWLGGRRPQSPPSWALPAWSGLVLQEPFPHIFLVSWCLQRWGEHPGSICGSEELRYLGASRLGKIP